MDCFYRLITESVLIHKSFPVPLSKDNWFSVILIQCFLIGSKCNNFFFWISQISRNFKENPNSQGILNWIIQIQIITGSNTKISKTHRLFKKILLSLSLSLPFSLVTAACASFVFLATEFFQSLDTVLREIT